MAQGSHDAAASFTPLEALIAQTHGCCLRPFRFFVSWQGVLTLAYTCVSPPEWRTSRCAVLHCIVLCAVDAALTDAGADGFYGSIIQRRAILLVSVGPALALPASDPTQSESALCTGASHRP